VRIIGGKHSGRRLGSLAGAATRPTGDRVREALFNIWQARVFDAHVWDVYAGTGAIGLEALSRGAAHAVFSESSREALRTLRHNIALLNEGARAEVWPKKAEDLLEGWREAAPQFDLVFLDPPWRVGVSAGIRSQLWRVLADDGMAVVESRQDAERDELTGLQELWSRRYGDTRLTAYGRSDAGRVEDLR
jgi:16S rRNA (guanine966-N2)-methyltransferase